MADQSIDADVAAVAEDVVRIRRALHRRPEIGLRLPETQALVLDELRGRPLEISTGTEVTSVVAVLRGTAPDRPAEAPAVLLRGDMDALPISEDSGEDFASEIDGAMHACGHDLHTAMLIGAARVLAACTDQLAGDVVFMFQPGEEGFDGASYMLNEGVLDAAGPRVSAAYGMHVMAAKIPPGAFTTRPGTFMSASAGLFVTVQGRGGHGSSPHAAADPIAVAAEIVTALQTYVTRRINIFDPAVITVGTFHAGTKRNIIPPTAMFEATVRSFSTAVADQLATELPRLCRGIAEAHGLTADVRYEVEYPPTINTPAETEFAESVVRSVFGDDRFSPAAFPDPGSEDFSRVLDAVGGCYLFLGACTSDDPLTAPGNHSPQATFDEAVLSDGVRLHTELAIRALQSLAR